VLVGSLAQPRLVAGPEFAVPQPLCPTKCAACRGGSACPYPATGGGPPLKTQKQVGAAAGAGWGAPALLQLRPSWAGAQASRSPCHWPIRERGNYYGSHTRARAPTPASAHAHMYGHTQTHARTFTHNVHKEMNPWKAITQHTHTHSLSLSLCSPTLLRTPCRRPGG
jgi:hypothetical protein